MEYGVKQRINLLAAALFLGREAFAAFYKEIKKYKKSGHNIVYARLARALVLILSNV